MKCPNCKLLNPPDAMFCDCGYDFRTGQLSLEQSSAERLAPKKRSAAATVGVYSLGVLLLAIGFLCKDAANTITRQQRDVSTFMSSSAKGTLSQGALAERDAAHVMSTAAAHGLCMFIVGVICVLVWYGWFKGRSGSIIIFVGFIVFAKGLGALVAAAALAFL